MNIMTVAKFSQFRLEIIYWSLRSFIMKGGDGAKRMDGVDRYFSHLQVSLYQSTSDNLVCDSSDIKQTYWQTVCS